MRLIVACIAVQLAIGGGAVAAVEIEIGTAIGGPGEEVTVDVFLHSGGELVAGTQNDIVFPANARIASAADGEPSCAANAEIGKETTVFAFLPLGCFRGECERVRVLVLSLFDLSPIPDGALLYSCRVLIAADAPPGSQVLGCAAAGVSDPDGNALSTTCTAGEIIAPGVTPSTTRTRPPNGTPPVTYTATLTVTPTPTFHPLTPRPLGAPCERDSHCAGRRCEDGICCATRCGADEVCGAYGRQCLQVCQADEDCTRGGECSAGVCAILRPAGGTVGLPTATRTPDADDGCAAGPDRGRFGWVALPALLLVAVRRRISRRAT